MLNTSRVSDSVDLGWSPRIHTFNKFSGDADFAGLDHSWLVPEQGDSILAGQ